MKKLIAVIIMLLVLPVLCFAMGGPAPEKAKKAAYPYLIDNFEDGNFNKEPEWFTFDNIIPAISRNSGVRGGDSVFESNAGEFSLGLKGTARDWYVGGIGTVLGIDASGYDTFNIDVFGNGENSGTLKIELYDDDNGNSDVEVDKNWKPTYDDLFAYELPVNWTGWKHVSVALSDFKKEGGGNKSWDPNLQGGSGGLVKVQLISVATSQTGSIDYNADNIELGLKK